MPMMRFSKRFRRGRNPSKDSFATQSSDDSGTTTTVSPLKRNQYHDRLYDEDESDLTEIPLSISKEWICQVESLEKKVDSRGQAHYYPTKKSNNTASREETLEAFATTQTPIHNEPQDQEKGPIILHIYEKSDVLKSYIYIRSPLILEVLQNLPDHTIQPSRIYEPYQSLWHKFGALRSYVQDQENPEDYRAHILVLLDFLEHCKMPDVSGLVALALPGAIAKTISYSNFWFLLPRGTLIVMPIDSDLRNSNVLRVTRVNPPIERKKDSNGKVSYSAFSIDCKGYRFIRGHINSFQMNLPLTPFEGSRPVTELEVVPLSLLDNFEEKRQAFIARGKKYWDFQGKHLQEIRDGSDSKGTLLEHERIMVDEEMFVLCHERPHSEPSQYFHDTRAGRGPRPPARLRLSSVTRATEDLIELPTSIDRTVKPTDDILMLCDSRVHGFSFRTKKWQLYHVQSLTAANFNKRSFDPLVLREEYKMTLKAMVAQHFTQGEDRLNDLVAGKGQGLIILLHGPPGVGKTLTAECVADMYERPLYSVTSGDIGTDPETVESKLLTIFEYAIRWNALLLLDEADVFLAERNLEDLDRNALVSVFLRNIEYFDGVLFLTTNRVGTIDEAFQSRLHITLGIDPLSVEDRRQIWYLFIKDLKHLSKEHRRALAREARDNWAHKDFNGRQIRNAIKTALTLARQDGIDVQASHFQTVLDIGSRFTSYLQRLKKMDQERFAEAIGTRLNLTAKPIKGPESPPLFAKVPKASSRSTESTNVDFGSDWDG